jgi:hypothetical protein
MIWYWNFIAYTQNTVYRKGFHKNPNRVYSGEYLLARIGVGMVLSRTTNPSSATLRISSFPFQNHLYLLYLIVTVEFVEKIDLHHKIIPVFKLNA